MALKLRRSPKFASISSTIDNHDLGVFWVADYKSEATFTKFNMTEPIWQTTCQTVELRITKTHI